jgi:predicted RNA-binding protein with PIN domain
VNSATHHLLVDAMNVIGSRPTGWWRDRDGAVRMLLAKLQRLTTMRAVEISVFVDGRPLHDVPEGVHEHVEVLYARRSGANAADDRVVECVRAHEDPGSLTVVTSDRALAGRAKAGGAMVLGASWLLNELDALDARDDERRG